MAHKTIAHDKLFHLLLVQSGPRWLRLCLSISMRDRDIISSAIKGVVVGVVRGGAGTPPAQTCCSIPAEIGVAMSNL